MYSYLVALGSNQRHPRYGAPGQVIRAALTTLKPHRTSRIIVSRPIGPSLRSYANAAAIVRSKLPPEAMLDHLQAIEAKFGRKRMGQPWRARIIDLDLILWSDGAWFSPRLTIPHTEFRDRIFVLQPAAQISGDWRDPISGLSVRQLTARLTRRRSMPKRPSWSGP